LQQANRQFASGGLTADDKEVAVETGAFLETAEDVGTIVVGVNNGKPVYLREVATILDDAEDPTQYVLHSSSKHGGTDEAAVTLSVAKRPGA
ncbi:efflux RND transporter permease subunit, partial [bacterium]|nr:efflux RND transporter permease subunit [bacterium]